MYDLNQKTACLQSQSLGNHPHGGRHQNKVYELRPHRHDDAPRI